MKAVGGETMDEGCNSVGESEGLLKLCFKISPSTEAQGISGKDSLVKGGCPGKDRAIGHVRKCKCDLFGIDPVDLLINNQVEGNGV